MRDPQANRRSALRPKSCLFVAVLGASFAGAVGRAQEGAHAKPDEVLVAEYRGKPIKAPGPVGADAPALAQKKTGRAFGRAQLVEMKYQMQEAELLGAIRTAIMDHWFGKLGLKIDQERRQQEVAKLVRTLRLRERLPRIIEQFGKETGQDMTKQVYEAAQKMVDGDLREATLIEGLVARKMIQGEWEFGLWLQSELKHVRIFRPDMLVLFINAPFRAQAPPIPDGQFPKAPGTPAAPKRAPPPEPDEEEDLPPDFDEDAPPPGFRDVPPPREGRLQAPAESPSGLRSARRQGARHLAPRLAPLRGASPSRG